MWSSKKCGGTGITIGNNTVIGASSVVTKGIPNGVITGATNAVRPRSIKIP